MLIATSKRLIFVTNGIHQGKFVEQFEYKWMNGIFLAPDGFRQKELLIDISGYRVVFDDILNNDHFKRFMNIVREKMYESKRQSLTTSSVSIPFQTESKYDKLAQLGQLRNDGVLTEEEFQNEKHKILNS